MKLLEWVKPNSHWRRGSAKMALSHPPMRPTTKIMTPFDGAQAHCSITGAINFQ